MRLYRATAVPRDGSQLSSLVDVLAYRAELPHRLSAVRHTEHDPQRLAAAGSPRHSAIAAYRGPAAPPAATRNQGVLAREMSHIRNNDLWVMGLADLMTRVPADTVLRRPGAGRLQRVLASITGDFPVSWSTVLLLYLAPRLFELVAARLIPHPRVRADAEAARLTGDPKDSATALQRLESGTGHFWEDSMFPVPAALPFRRCCVRIPQPRTALTVFCRSTTPNRSSPSTSSSSR